jgi:hypothetical protein
MKKLIHLLTLILVINLSFQTHVQAQNPKEWKALGSNATGHYFYDPIIINGDLGERKISIKLNRIAETKDGFKSQFLEYSVFCEEKATLIQTNKNYSELDLIGNESIIPRSLGNEKRIQKPNTLGMQFVDAACKNNGTQNSQPSLIVSEINKLLEDAKKDSDKQVQDVRIVKDRKSVV